MDAQSADHFAIIVLVIFCNVFYFVFAARKEGRPDAGPLILTSRLIGAWVAVGLTLFIFSFLYKDNPLFKTWRASLCRHFRRVFGRRGLV